MKTQKCYVCGETPPVYTPGDDYPELNHSCKGNGNPSYSISITGESPEQVAYLWNCINIGHSEADFLGQLLSTVRCSMWVDHYEKQIELIKQRLEEIGKK